MRRIAAAALAAVAMTSVLAACRGGSAEPPPDRPLSSTRTSAAGARLVLADSVLLAESDTTFIGKPSALAIGSGGEIFVADELTARVLEFSPGGEFVRAYGRKGNGPGELERPISLVLFGDSLIAVGNVRQNSPVLFDRRTGAWVATGRVSGYIKSGQQVGDSLWFGVMSRTRATSLAAWRPGADSMRYFGPVAGEYVAAPRLWQIMPQAPFTAWSDTVALGFAGVNEIVILTGEAPVDTVDPPVARRRGVPANLVEEYGRDMGLEHYTQLASILMQVGRTPAGQLVLVHHDVSQHGDLFTATGYVTLVSPDRRTACVDAVLELSPDAIPFTAVVGDRVVALEQVADGREARSFLRTYEIDDSSCEWVPAV